MFEFDADHPSRPNTHAFHHVPHRGTHLCTFVYQEQFRAKTWQLHCLWRRRETLTSDPNWNIVTVLSHRSASKHRGGMLSSPNVSDICFCASLNKNFCAAEVWRSLIIVDCGTSNPKAVTFLLSHRLVNSKSTLVLISYFAAKFDNWALHYLFKLVLISCIYIYKIQYTRDFLRPCSMLIWKHKLLYKNTYVILFFQKCILHPLERCIIRFN